MKCFIDQDINELNLEPISYKVATDEDWSIEKIDRIEQEYRAYLQIIRNASNTDSIAPSRNIDTYWHAHILDTLKYVKDCDQIFGRYIHHYPYAGIFGGNEAKKQREKCNETEKLVQAYL